MNQIAENMFAVGLRQLQAERTRLEAAKSGIDAERCYYGCGSRARVNSLYCSVECAIRAETEPK